MTLLPNGVVAPTRLARLMTLLVVVLTSLSTPVYAQSDRDHEVAAAMIFNFARFTQWPDDMLEEGKPFTICTMKSAPVYSALLPLEGRSIKSRSVAVRAMDAERVDGDVCHIELLSNESPAMDAASRGTLYVSTDESAFADIASLTIIRVGRQTRFTANPSAAKRSDVQLSSKLLDLAIKIH